MNYITKLNQIKSNFQKENKIFTLKRNINIVSDKNSIFTFKSSDIYKNKKIFILQTLYQKEKEFIIQEKLENILAQKNIKIINK